MKTPHSKKKRRKPRATREQTPLGIREKNAQTPRHKQKARKGTYEGGAKGPRVSRRKEI